MPRLESTRAAVLDTHVWVWLSSGDKRGQAFRSFTGQPIVSAISVWEVSMLASKGRLELKPDSRTWIEDNLKDPIEHEPLSPEICVDSCALENFQGDPADRLIVATAMVLGVPLITADREMIAWAKKHPELTILGT
ncbi:MAG: type II toxin-antitoxin system VapC family toxin [Opitutaceae bacterium]|jgi:PIN domain nuclease of toxin-antitoxin system|nr:type II toxin-antitoxin system VapC family toxin [Opitutaceae bacterium]